MGKNGQKWDKHVSEIFDFRRFGCLLGAWPANERRIAASGQRPSGGGIGDQTRCPRAMRHKRLTILPVLVLSTLPSPFCASFHLRASDTSKLARRPSAAGWHLPPHQPPNTRTCMLVATSSSASADEANDPQISNDGTDSTTILGLGSLLSERSSRLTFPNLRNFRLGRVPNHRRVFMHPAAIFFERGIANMGTLEISSLSCEQCDGAGFVCSVFEVPKEEILVEGDDSNSGEGTIIPSQAYLEREEEFDIVEVPYVELDGVPEQSDSMGKSTVATGILCRRWTDEAYAQRWGPGRLPEKYGPHGITSIWDQWTKPDSGILPCAAYLRHCVLAAEKMGPVCYDSFVDETYLADRTTTIGEYLGTKPEVMATIPPGDLALRYGG